MSATLQGVFIEQAVDSLISKSFDDEYFDQEDGTPGLRIAKSPTALSNLYIPRIYFKSHTAVYDLVITISDASHSETFTIDAESDEEVTIETNFTSYQRKVDITYTSNADPSDSGVSPYTCPINEYHIYAHRSCNPCAGHRYLIVHGLNFSGSETSSYYGIRADIELICDKAKMVCLIAPQNKSIIFNMLQIEVLQEWIASDRFNFLAMNSKEWAADRIVQLQNELELIWFGASNGIVNLLQSSEKKCFKCTGYEQAESLP